MFPLRSLSPSLVFWSPLGTAHSPVRHLPSPGTDRPAAPSLGTFCFRLCRAGPYGGQSLSCLLCGRGQTFQGLLLGVEDARLLQERGCRPLTPRVPCLSVSMLPHRSRLPRGGDPRPRTTASLVPMVWGQTGRRRVPTLPVKPQGFVFMF